MDNFQRLVQQIRSNIFVGVFGPMILSAATVWFGTQVWGYGLLTLLVCLLVAFTTSLIVSQSLAKRSTEALEYLWRAIVHVSPAGEHKGAPNLKQIKVGREVVTNAVMQVYQLASGVQGSDSAGGEEFSPENVLDNLPMPVLVASKEHKIILANNAACKYLGIDHDDIIGSDYYSVMDLVFQNENTLDKWLEECRENRATADNTWEHVKLNSAESQKNKMFDLAVHYSKNAPGDAETISCIFDKTGSYKTDQDGLSFIALAVHELRTPLTLLRGYIEVFEDELSGELSPELQHFLINMKVSADQLSGFVSNILKVARVEENQLYLQLKEENWGNLLQGICGDMNLRVKAHNKHLEINIQDDLPHVGADRISMYEVVSNLIDNAVKYSDKSDRIIVRSFVRDDGMIETTVQDFGVGIPESNISNLFEKFYRNHNTRASVGGTGLGLFLCKAIVKAHGGNIWVRSQEGKGTTFGFTLQAYDQLSDELKSPDNKGITRVAHGWIKNHSFYSK